jgi:hypothetical protein
MIAKNPILFYSYADERRIAGFEILVPTFLKAICAYRSAELTTKPAEICVPIKKL